MKTKYCPSCNNELTVDKFHKSCDRGDGLMGRCIQCARTYNSNKIKTKRGLLCSIFTGQKASCKQRKHEMPSYTKEEFIKWVLLDCDFHKIFKNWVESGFERWKRPSIDRKDDYKTYTLDNIQVMTWLENNEKSHRDRKSGINNKMSKAVVSWDLDGNFLDDYYSLSQASRALNLSTSGICKCCKEKNKTAGGLKWTYKYCPIP